MKDSQVNYIAAKKIVLETSLECQEDWKMNAPTAAHNYRHIENSNFKRTKNLFCSFGAIGGGS